MRQAWIITKRELYAYFATPMAFVFIAIFVAMTGAFTFYIGRFFDRNQASLETFFSFHPWLYLLLVPAVAMRLWAWLFCGIALLLTFPMWLTVNVLGAPDNAVVFVSYIGSFLMAGAFLAIGMCMSALTRNQIIAFIAGSVVCFLFTMSGLDLVLNFFRLWAPDAVVTTIASFSFLTRFEALSRGIIDIRDLIYFLSLISFWLFATVIAVETKKAA